MERADRRLSKTLALLLRHDPARFGVVLDGAGWADLEAVVAGLQAAGIAVSAADVLRVVDGGDKVRLAVRDGRIRALQGHSVPVDLGLERCEPPAVLWHGTVDRFRASILREGLRPMARHHVHLSAERETAKVVGGRRRGGLWLLRVDAGGMAIAGHAFFQAENGVWLTDRVPVAFLTSDEA